MIFLGPLFDRAREDELYNKSKSHYISNQVNGFQWNIIDGLLANGEDNFSIVNVLPIGTWPRSYSDFILKNANWNYKNISCYEVGCVNLPFIKQWQRFLKIKRYLKKSSDKKILIYSTYEPFLRAIYRLDSSYDITMIVTDLPEYYDHTKTNCLFRLLRKLNNRKIYKYCGRVNKFVLLTEEMKHPLKVGNRPYIVVDGICNPDKQLEYCKDVDTTKFNIAYAGGLNVEYGILNLVNAFQDIENNDFRLHIFGSGDAESAIEAAAQKDSRIAFHGFQKKAYVDSFLNSCNLLVNTRQNIGEYVKYSFPSKTLEYLVSGVPILMYKLSGVSDEYDNYLNYVSDNSVKALADKIVEIYDDQTGKYTTRSLEGKRFVKKYKSSTAQARKIIKMVGTDKDIG